MTKVSKPTLEKQPGRRIHMPEAMDEAEPVDYLAQLAGFDNPAEGDERRARRITNCPRYVWEQVGVICTLTPKWKSRETIVAFCLECGIDMLEDLPRWRDIEASRKILERAGDHRAESLKWSFQLTAPAGGGTDQPVFPRINEKTWNRCVSHAHRIGVPHQTLAILSIMAVLLHMPIANHLRRHMVAQLRTFRDRVSEQADDAVALAARALPAESDLALSFYTDVLDGGEA